MCINIRQRSQAPEMMDDFSIKGNLLKESLHKLAQINKLLGGNQITLQGVALLIKDIPADQAIRILDVGCGHGDMLRRLADFAKKKKRKFILSGVDANPATIAYARELSQSHPYIHYHCQDIMKPSYWNQSYDIILCTLTLHHFKDEAICQSLKFFRNRSTIGIVINDLQRNMMAYRLFQLICFIFRLNNMVKADGLVSILRGFRKKELQHLAAACNLGHYSLRWKWAFRYQWIIYSLHFKVREF